MWLFTVNFLIFFTVAAATADAVCVLFLYIYILSSNGKIQSINEKIKRKNPSILYIKKHTHTNTRASSKKKIQVHHNLQIFIISKFRFKQIEKHIHTDTQNCKAHDPTLMMMIEININKNWRARVFNICLCVFFVNQDLNKFFHPNGQTCWLLFFNIFDLEFDSIFMVFFLYTKKIYDLGLIFFFALLLLHIFTGNGLNF